MAISEGLRAAARAQIESNPATFQIAPGRADEVIDRLAGDISLVGGAITYYAGGGLATAVESLKLQPGADYLFQREPTPKPARTIARTRDELRRQHDEANGVTVKGLLTKHKHLSNRPRVK